ncbi:hypothetical protein ZMO02_07120 [Zymomonas mobilis subsp. pomaceae]|nr:hypothetical protein ZMO02_07120 [Zymomonas mobilis subsp. pomaceae]
MVGSSVARSVRRRETLIKANKDEEEDPFEKAKEEKTPVRAIMDKPRPDDKK